MSLGGTIRPALPWSVCSSRWSATSHWSQTRSTNTSSWPPPVKDAVIALVMRLILDDEARHHALLMRIATTLRECLNWTQSPNAPPRTTGGEATVNAAGMATTARTLIEEEHAGARAMRRLASQERGLDGGLDSLLLEMMAMDSDKQARRLSNRCVRRLRRAVSPRSRPARVT
jgi:hypothetical protein